MYYIPKANIIAIICIQCFLIIFYYDSYKHGTGVSLLYVVFAGITCGTLLSSQS